MATALPVRAKRFDDELVAFLNYSGLLLCHRFDRRVVDVVVSHKFNPLRSRSVAMSCLHPKNRIHFSNRLIGWSRPAPGREPRSADFESIFAQSFKPQSHNVQHLRWSQSHPIPILNAYTTNNSMISPTRGLVARSVRSQWRLASSSSRASRPSKTLHKPPPKTTRPYKPYNPFKAVNCFQLNTLTLSTVNLKLPHNRRHLPLPLRKPKPSSISGARPGSPSPAQPSQLALSASTYSAPSPPPSRHVPVADHASTPPRPAGRRPSTATTPSSLTRNSTCPSGGWASPVYGNASLRVRRDMSWSWLWARDETSNTTTGSH